MKEKSQKANKQKVYKQLSYFDPLISFANEELREENCKEILWNAMGDERFSRVTYTVNGKTTEEVILHSNINSELTERLGYGWFFPAEKLREVVKKIEDAIKDVKPDLPKITGQEPTFEGVKELKKMIREVLDLLVDSGTVEQKQGNWIQITGQEFNYWGLPPTISNIKKYHEVCKRIEIGFGRLAERTAIVDDSGFILFEDIGEDASRTLSWMLQGLVNVVFKSASVTMKK